MSYPQDDRHADRDSGRDLAHRHDVEADDFEAPRASELTLGTGTILGIFLGLVLLCGAFFAFGYNMGSRSRQPPVDASASADGPSATTGTFDHFKPSPGAPAIQPVPGYLSQKEADTANRSASASAYNTPGAPTSANPALNPPTPRTPAVVSMPTPDVGPPSPGPARLAPPAPRVPAEPAPATPATGSFNVQVAAVSHQEDADLLVNALKRKGYTVAARSEPQDKLFHIQIGPFAGRKEAEAMRQRLLTDGYNAILK